MNDRLPWRLFGLIYAHPTPIADTTVIKNKAGLPLPPISPEKRPWLF